MKSEFIYLGIKISDVSGNMTEKNRVGRSDFFFYNDSEGTCNILYSWYCPATINYGDSNVFKV